MNVEQFYDQNHRFSMVLFLQPEDLETKRREWEELGKLSHIKLVVQPCPFEGIEFLYRVNIDLPGHQTSAEKDVFWQAITLDKTVPDSVWSEISRHHFEFLLSILHQDTQKMLAERRVVESLVQPYL